MEWLKEWALALCAAAVMCAVFEMMSSSGKNSKAFRLVTASVMLCVIISPLSRMGSCMNDFDSFIAAPAETGERLCSAIEEQTRRAMTGAVEQIVRQCAGSLGVELEEISVGMDISGDGCITIGQVTAVIAGTDRKTADRLENDLESVYGIQSEVLTAEERAWI